MGPGGPGGVLPRQDQLRHHPQGRGTPGDQQRYGAQQHNTENISQKYLQLFIQHIFLVSTQQAANTQSFYLQANDEDGNFATITVEFY